MTTDGALAIARAYDAATWDAHERLDAEWAAAEARYDAARAHAEDEARAFGWDDIAEELGEDCEPERVLGWLVDDLAQTASIYRDDARAIVCACAIEHGIYLG